jgi:hypothetical protein
MNLSHYLTMDPHLLLGLLNTELRNHCDSLDDLVKTHNLDPERLIEIMTAAGYDYHPEQNQFR